jgi:hypothetical protein
MLYSKKDNSMEQNVAQVVINKTNMSFYQATNDDNNKYSTSCSVNNNSTNYLFFKQSESIAQTGTYKKDTVTSRDDGHLIETYTTRKYNRDGKLTTSSIQNNTYNCSLNEYVISKFEELDYTRELISTIENYIPGITLYLRNINQHINDVLAKHKVYTN